MADSKPMAQIIADAIQAGETTLEKCKERVKAGKLDAFDLIDAQTILTDRAAAAKTAAGTIVFKVSKPDAVKGVKGGCVCAYGVNGSRPVSLYAEQWLRLIDALPGLLKTLSTDTTFNVKTSTVKDIQARAAELLKTRFAAV